MNDIERDRRRKTKRDSYAKNRERTAAKDRAKCRAYYERNREKVLAQKSGRRSTDVDGAKARERIAHSKASLRIAARRSVNRSSGLGARECSKELLDAEMTRLQVLRVCHQLGVQVQGMAGGMATAALTTLASHQGVTA